MDPTINSFIIFIYLLGMSTLFGGLIAQVGESKYEVERALLYGVFLQLIASVSFVVLNTVNANYPVTILRIGAIIMALVILLYARKREFTWNLFHAVLTLTLVDVFLAVFWF